MPGCVDERIPLPGHPVPPARSSLPGSRHSSLLSTPSCTCWSPWKQRMTTSSNGNIFRVTGHLCGEFTVTGEFPAQRPVMRGFDVFFDMRPYKRLSKQWWGWWFETPSCPLWRQCNGLCYFNLCRAELILENLYFRKLVFSVNSPLEKWLKCTCKFSKKISALRWHK